MNGYRIIVTLDVPVPDVANSVDANLILVKQAAELEYLRQTGVPPAAWGLSVERCEVDDG